MIINDLKYSLNDVAIVPDVQTNVEHRASCDPYYSDNMLPLFTAPMTSVVGTDNYMEFIKNGITPILPRTISLGKRLEFMNKGVWISMSLDEFIIYFLKNPESVDLTMKKVLIDIANGHMKKLTNTVNEAKTKHGKHLTIMAGNIANPETYKELSMAGADYIRIGIGNGYGCLTSTNVGVNYPMASLIDECHEIKKCYNGSKIIADGGFKGYADINIINPDASSTGEVLYEIFDTLDWKISKETASALYTAILTDTGSFRFDNTTSEALKSASKLVKKGANPSEIYKKVYESSSKNHVLFQAYCISKAEFYNDDKIACTTIYKKDIEKFNAPEDCTEGLTEKLRAIVTTEVAFVVREIGASVSKVSMRSKNADVAEICAEFGGGGHKLAAGCVVKGTVKETVKKILDEIGKRKI